MLHTQLALHAQAKISLVATKQPASLLSADAIEWLSGRVEHHVRITSVATDFYLLIYLRDVVATRNVAAWAEGFNPVTSAPCRVYLEPAQSEWHVKLTQLFVEQSTWTESFLFTYLCAAVAGELRHAQSHITSLEAEHSRALQEYKIQGSSHSRKGVQANFLSTLHKDKLIDYLTVAGRIFNDYHWPSHYGGPKWGEIAQTGLDRVTGVLDPITFVDRVFDLKHNGGPMFDKSSSISQQMLQSFLSSKLHADTDENWAGWLSWASPAVLSMLKSAQALGIWEASTSIPVDDPDDPEKSPYKSTKVATIDYPELTGHTCPEGIDHAVD